MPHDRIDFNLYLDTILHSLNVAQAMSPDGFTDELDCLTLSVQHPNMEQHRHERDLNH